MFCTSKSAELVKLMGLPLPPWIGLAPAQRSSTCSSRYATLLRAADSATLSAWLHRSLMHRKRCRLPCAKCPPEAFGWSSHLQWSPIGSMYGIYANIWGILMVNVTIYTIHGSYGSWFTSLREVSFINRKGWFLKNWPSFRDVNIWASWIQPAWELRYIEMH